MNKFIIFTISSFFFCQVLLAEKLGFIILPKDTISKDKQWVIKGFLQDEASLWSSPLRITGKRFCFWVPVIGATMISMANDEKIYSEIKKYQARHEWVSDVSPVITCGGKGTTALAVSGLFYFGGLVFNDEKAMQTGALCAEALAHAGLIVTVGKLLTGQQRPSYNGQVYWHWFPSSLKQFGTDPQSKYDAFPSGHSIVAWSLATVIARQYKDNIIIPILVYTAATGVALSRITQDEHWLSDVIVGSALGYTIGNFIVKKRKNTHWTLLPSASSKNIELTSLYKF
jgi:membrane-associated phospholipid phosphatase